MAADLANIHRRPKPQTHATMVATQEEKKQKTCPRETYQQFCAAKFGSGSTATVQSYQKDDALKKELREKFHAACDSFGFDQVDAPYDATAAIFADNKTLAELYNVRPKGEGSAKSGASSTAHRSGVTYDEGLACAAMVEHFKVSDALEIGLAYGHSALFTACALPAHGTLVAVDPAQAMGADEGGWEDKGAQVCPRLHSNPHRPPPPGSSPHSSPSLFIPRPRLRTPHPIPRTAYLIPPLAIRTLITAGGARLQAAARRARQVHVPVREGHGRPAAAGRAGQAHPVLLHRRAAHLRLHHARRLLRRPGPAAPHSPPPLPSPLMDPQPTPPPPSTHNPFNRMPMRCGSPIL